MVKRIKFWGIVPLFCLLATGVALPITGGQSNPSSNSQQRAVIQTHLPSPQLRAFSTGIVSVKEPFAAIPGSYLEQQFVLPRGTILETLDVQGFKVDIVRKLSTDGTLVVEIQGVPQTNAPSLSYLVQNALRWKSLYAIDISTGDFKAFVSTDNFCDLPKAEITFVMGSPHLVGNAIAGRSYKNIYSEMDAAPSAPEAPVGLGELWECRYEGLIELRKGESVRLPLFDASLKLESIYYWDGGEVVLKHEFMNSLDRPLAPGRIECYKDGSWVGEDTMDWVAIGAEGEIISQYAPDIEIEEKTIRKEEKLERRIVGKEVSVQNHKQAKISIEVVRYLPGRANLLSASPKPTQEGKKLTWTLTIGPGESQNISYLYEEILRQKKDKW